MKIMTVLFFSILISAFVFAIHCGTSETVQPPQKVVPVKMAPVLTEEISIPVYAGGLLVSKQQIRLSFKTGGIIDKIYVKEGQNVAAGEALAQLELNEIKAQVQQAKSGFEKAKRDFDRTTKFYTDGVAALEQKQNAETQLNIAESNLRIAEYNLEHSTIKAPSAGRILKSLVETSELIGPGHPAFYFGAGGEDWLVRVGVADRDIIKLALGDPASVFFDALPGVEFPAKVVEIAQAADPQNGTFEVEVALEAGGRRLAAGFVAKVTMKPKSTTRLKLVPISALVEAQGDKGAVYTVAADSAQKAQVVVGPILGDRIVILAGLEDIQNVVAAGAAYLKVGDKVKVLE